MQTPMQRENIGEETYEYLPLGQYVVRAPAVCGGRPTFKYTRIEVTGTLGRLASGEPLDSIVAGYGGRVPPEAVQEAVDLVTKTFLNSLPELATTR